MHSIVWIYDSDHLVAGITRTMQQYLYFSLSLSLSLSFSSLSFPYFSIAGTHAHIIRTHARRHIHTRVCTQTHVCIYKYARAHICTCLLCTDKRLHMCVGSGHVGQGDEQMNRRTGKPTDLLDSVLSIPAKLMSVD